MSSLKEAVYEQTEKVFTAFVTWGLGILLMVAYCVTIFWLEKLFGLYVMIIGALVFLTVAFFLIDLWWNIKNA